MRRIIVLALAASLGFAPIAQAKGGKHHDQTSSPASKGHSGGHGKSAGLDGLGETNAGLGSWLGDAGTAKKGSKGGAASSFDVGGTGHRAKGGQSDLGYSTKLR